MPATAIPQAHSIGDLINGKLNPTNSLYCFPEDRPKYYTTLKFSQFKGGQGAGGYRDTFTNRSAEARQWAREFFEKGGIFGKQLDSAVDTFLADIKQGLVPGQQGAATFTNETIILPLPVNLLDVNKVHWDEKPIVPWVQPILDIMGIGGTDPARALGGLFGLAPNFFQTMLFDRPEYKRHELSFKLAPRNFGESTMIRDIIWALNNAMSPGLGGGGFLFTFPNMVQITLRPNDGWLFKFKPAVIEAIAVNYAGGDQKKAFYHGSENPPESVEITMHVVEIEYWLQGDFTLDNT